MEIAQPHVVVRSFGPGIGRDLVAALGVHAVEVSEARDRSDACRVAAGRGATVVIVTDAADAGGAVAEVRELFPGVPILLCPGPPGAGPPLAGAGDAIGTIPASASLPEICWHVLAAIARWAGRPGITEHTIGPFALAVDAAGIVCPMPPSLGCLIMDGRRLRPGDSLLSVVAPPDRAAVGDALGRAGDGHPQFLTLRILDTGGSPHAVLAGFRPAAGGRVAVLIQPLVFAGQIGGRHADVRDPITGLLTRWEMSRRLEVEERSTAPDTSAALVLVRLDGFSEIADRIGSRLTDAVLVRVAEAVTQTFPWPALASRLMGDAFLVFVPDGTAAIESRVAGLIRLVNGIPLPGRAQAARLAASASVARVADGDFDLAIRLAEAAVGAAQAAGGNRTVVAGSATFTSSQAGELVEAMDRGSWEVWLQPVVRVADGRPAFHEALARFDLAPHHLASRADFFLAGRAAGLLERFDRLMLERCVALVTAHPAARLSVNVTHETFVSDVFPDATIAVLERAAVRPGRIMLELAARCLALPADLVRPRLERLAAAGIPVALDDFGSGICRLTYVTQYPVACVKLDALVTGYIDDDPLQREFVRTLVGVCRARGIVTVAEYTRSPEQRARLVADGVDLLQGALPGMPRPAAEVFPGIAAPVPAA